MLDTIGKLLVSSFLENPILVVGTGRSGTSVLLQAIGEHSRIISALGESPFIPYVGALIHPFEFRHNREYHLESLATSKDYIYEQFRRLCFESAMGRYYGLKRFLSNPGFLLKKKWTAKYWCAKTFPNEVEAQGLARLYPNIKILYIFRNGCDVVYSRMKFRGMSRIEFEEQCAFWAKSVEKYAYLGCMEQAVSVRQEDLASKPDEVFASVQTFIGVDYEAGPTRFAQTSLIHSLGDRTQTAVDVQNVLVNRPKGYTTWTSEQKKTFIDLCSEGMKKLGYEIPF
jgi:hypothetical protein